MLSLIIPVYNRPEEIRELLDSLAAQTNPDVEILIVEDGSSQTCEDVVRACSQACPSLRLRYLTKTNSGPGLSRNAGAEQAEGDFFVFLDSDCVVPPEWSGRAATLSAVRTAPGRILTRCRRRSVIR